MTCSIRSAVLRVLASCAVPLTEAKLRQWILYLFFLRPSPHDIQQVLQRLYEERPSPIRRWGPTLLAAGREDTMRVHSLIAKRYRLRGMRLLQVSSSLYLRYIPPEATHQFLEFGPSTVDGAGWGVFVRRGVTLPMGCVLCEYTGRRRQIPARRASLPYGITLTNGWTIDGLDVDGCVSCYAAVINDAGPRVANVEFQEYTDAFPDHALVVTRTDVHGGSELFVLYGAKYWGLRSYEDVPTETTTQKRKRERSEDTFLTSCRRCRVALPPRLLPLHLQSCSGAPPSGVSMGNPLPHTTLTDEDWTLPTGKRRKAATFFVSSAWESFSFSYALPSSEKGKKEIVSA